MKNIYSLLLCLSATAIGAQTPNKDAAFRAKALCLVATFIAADKNPHYQATDLGCDSCTTVSAMLQKTQSVAGFKEKFKFACDETSFPITDKETAAQYTEKLVGAAIEKHDYRKKGEFAEPFTRLLGNLNGLVAAQNFPAAANDDDIDIAGETPEKTNFLTKYWAYILGILGVLIGTLLGYFLPKGNKDNDPIATQARYDSLDEMYKKSMAENQRLQANIVQLTQETNTQDTALRKAQNELQALRKTTQIVPPTPAAAPSKANAPHKLYALYPDRGATGFGVAILNEEPDDNALYIITVQPDGENATFAVTTNRAIYQRGYNDFGTYYQAICDFNSLPTAQSTIATLQEGKLALRGNVWTVTQKAQLQIS